MNWKRRFRKTLLDHVKNIKIRQIVGVEYDVMSTTREKQPRWYGHTRRMKEEL